jgi:hypothetical protein
MHTCLGDTDRTVKALLEGESGIGPLRRYDGASLTWRRPSTGETGGPVGPQPPMATTSSNSSRRSRRNAGTMNLLRQWGSNSVGMFNETDEAIRALRFPSLKQLELSI